MTDLNKPDNIAPHNAFRLDRDNAKLFGVCSGLANTSGIDATVWRIGLGVATLLGVGLTIPIYLAVALIAD